jgi:hypothetical protein
VFNWSSLSVKLIQVTKKLIGRVEVSIPGAFTSKTSKITKDRNYVEGTTKSVLKGIAQLEMNNKLTEKMNAAHLNSISKKDALIQEQVASLAEKDASITKKDALIKKHENGIAIRKEQIKKMSKKKITNEVRG